MPCGCRCGQLATNLRTTRRVAHNTTEVHNAPRCSSSLSTIHSQPDTLTTLGRHRFIPNVHSPSYCSLDISEVPLSKKAPGDTSIHCAQSRLTTPDVTPID